MTKGTYRLAKVQGGLAAHELHGGKVVTHDQPQEFDPEAEGLTGFVEPADGPAAPPALSAKKAEAKPGKK